MTMLTHPYYNGCRVTLLAIPEENMPEEHGVLASVETDNGTVIVTLDSKYRFYMANDDGVREVMVEQVCFLK